MLVRSFEDLDAWKAAHQLTLAVYRVTKSFPREEMFGLTSQLRRASVSIEANMAEGFGRRSRAELLRYARIADGSLQEVRCCLRISSDVGYLKPATYKELCGQVSRVGALIGGLQKSLTAAKKRAQS